MKETKFVTVQEYILNNFNHLFKTDEITVLSEISNVQRFHNSSHLKDLERSILLKRYKLTEDELKLYTPMYIERCRNKFVARILAENADSIEWNICPICGELARTTASKQGPCGHRW